MTARRLSLAPTLKVRQTWPHGLRRCRDRRARRGRNYRRNCRRCVTRHSPPKKRRKSATATRVPLIARCGEPTVDEEARPNRPSQPGAGAAPRRNTDVSIQRSRRTGPRDPEPRSGHPPKGNALALRRLVVCTWRRWETPAVALFRWRNQTMFMRRLAIAALVGAVVASVGCSCHKCRGTVGYSPPPCCGGAAPPGPIAVPAGPPPAPAPVSAGFAPAAPCPTCNGH
jgi:hypothetical protein